MTVQRVKRFFAIILVLLTLTLNLFPEAAFAKSVFEPDDPAPTDTAAPSGEAEPQSDPTATLDPNTIKAPYAELVDLDSGTVLFEKSSTARVYPASTTKIMTCILALEKSELSNVVTLDESIKNISSDSSTAGLYVGEQLTLEQLLYALMLASGNDAACGVAAYIGGSEAAFVDMMNQKAQELGMTSTHYVNPHGLSNDDHYTSVRDMGILLCHAYQNETFRKIVSALDYTIPPTNTCAEGHTYHNTNFLLDPESSNYYYEYTTGVKTGFTSSAGYCVVSSAEKDGMRLGALVYFGEQYSRFSDAATMLYWGFSAYRYFDPEELFSLDPPITVKVERATSSDPAGGTLSLLKQSDDGFGGVILKSEADALKAKYNDIKLETVPATITLEAPITKGQEIGTFKYTLDGKTLLTGTLTASRDVEERAPFFDWSHDSSMPLVANMSWMVFPLLILFAAVCFMLFVLNAFMKQNRRNERRRSYRDDIRRPSSPIPEYRRRRP